MLKNISIFGSTGFIGRDFTDYYKGAKDCVDRINPNPKYPDVLYCIGTVDNYNIYSNPTLDIETNLVKLIQDLEILRKKFGTFTINYLSTWFVYGKNGVIPFSVEDCCDPRGFYSISKLAAEKFIITYCETYHLNYRILRLCNVYGVGDDGISSKKNALQYLISKIKKNETVELYNGGNVTRDFMHVRDISRAISLILNNADYNLIINVGSGIETRFLDVIIKAKEVFQSTSKINSISPPYFHEILQNSRSCLEISYLRKLGFNPKHNIFSDIVNL